MHATISLLHLVISFIQTIIISHLSTSSINLVLGQLVTSMVLLVQVVVLVIEEGLVLFSVIGVVCLLQIV